MTTWEVNRKELAGLLRMEPEALPDHARLGTELALDSLAMMTVLAWLEGRGGAADRPLTTVGDVLALAEKGLRVRITTPDGEVLGPAPLSRPDPLIPVLESRSIRLMPVLPDDVGFLFDLTVRPENCFRWRYRGVPPQIERFADDLWRNVMVQFVVRRQTDGQPIGHVVAYAPNPSLQFAYLGAVFVPQLAGTGVPAHAVELFVRYLFHAFPLNKLYLEIPGFNWDQLRSGEGRLFTVEGLLRDHSWYAGRLWDEHVCAIYRDGIAS